MKEKDTRLLMNYCLPGLPSLIKIGMEKVILPEVFHLYSEIKK